MVDSNDDGNDYDDDDVVNMRFPNMTKDAEKLFTDIILQAEEGEEGNNKHSIRLEVQEEEEGSSTSPNRRRSSVLKLRPSIMSRETSERVIESLMKLDEQKKGNNEDEQQNDYEASFEMKKEEKKKSDDDDDGIISKAAESVVESPLMISLRKSIIASTASLSLLSDVTEGIEDVDNDSDVIDVIDPSSLPYKPIAGSTTIQLKNPTDPAIDEKTGKVLAGWRTVDPSTLQVRGCGYNGSDNKCKIGSPGDLYECINADVFESQQRVPDIASKVVLPKVEFVDNDDNNINGNGNNTKTWTAPDLFVITVALPTSQPSMYGANSNKDDGLGYTVVMYYAMRQETRDILRRITAADYNNRNDDEDNSNMNMKINAVRLFEKWCRCAPSDKDFFSRFKVLPQAENLKEMGLPSWIEKFNGMAFLVKRPGETGYVFTHPATVSTTNPNQQSNSCMEFDVSLHPFPYLAKKGICYMKETYFEKTVVTFAFCIEGRLEDELPECLLGAFQLCYPNPVHAIQAEDWFTASAGGGAK